MNMQDFPEILRFLKKIEACLIRHHLRQLISIFSGPFSKIAHTKVALLWVRNHGNVDEAMVDIDSAEGDSDAGGVGTFGDVKAVTTGQVQKLSYWRGV